MNFPGWLGLGVWGKGGNKANISHYNPSSLINLAWRGIRLLGKLNPQLRDLCKAHALSGLNEY